MDRRRLVESHLVEVNVSAVHRHLFARQQAAHRDERLFERRQRRRGSSAHLLHPALHAVADAREEPARGQRGQRGDLHRGDRRVAGDGGQDADTHAEPFGRRQRRGGQAHAGRVEAVLDDPQLIGAAIFELPGDVGDEARRERAVEAHADRGTNGRRAHQLTVSSAEPCPPRALVVERG